LTEESERSKTDKTASCCILLSRKFADERNAIDRLARAAGKEPGMIPIVDEDPLKPSALPTADSYKFFTAWAKKSDWKNECTVKT